ncbi:MAG: ATP-binding cassette domain-containing protein [Sedimentisphaerales bacterium]|nr:ATP-binding cassette domain-containing protein [Sedimentisphaerales bacterium]
MAEYTITKSFTNQTAITDKVAAVCRMFGLAVAKLRQKRTHSCRLEINSGDIVYITGPSGCGKSVLLAELEKSIPAQERINLSQIKLPADKTVIDCFETGPLASLRLLGTAGLNDCFCVLNQPCNLSEGQQYRFRLAMALASGRKFVFADEFCSGLDRITAASVSWRLRQFADKTGTTFILASSHRDTLLDLSPEVIVTKDFSGTTEVVYKNKRRNV